MNCPICFSALVAATFYRCIKCNNYLCNLDGSKEVIIGTDRKWWLWIAKDHEIHLFSQGIKSLAFPYTPINYLDPQETIDKLIRLQAFL